MLQVTFKFNLTEYKSKVNQGSIRGIVEDQPSEFMRDLAQDLEHRKWQKVGNDYEVVLHDLPTNLSHESSGPFFCAGSVFFHRILFFIIFFLRSVMYIRLIFFPSKLNFSPVVINVCNKVKKIVDRGLTVGQRIGYLKMCQTYE